MKSLLIAWFTAILLAMIAVTTWASLDRGIFAAGAELLEYPWFLATLCDAYFGFLTFYVWVAYKEATIARQLVWLMLILALGNIAMAIYVLIQLARLPPGAPLSAMLLRAQTSEVVRQVTEG